jgi:hypothetical protein
VCLLLLGAVIGYLVWPHGHGPLVQGRKLSLWLDDCELTWAGPLKLSSTSEEAIRQEGDVLIPLLTEWLQSPPGTHQRHLVFRHPAFPSRTWQPVQFVETDDGWRAFLGFRALGAQASSAFPTLVDLAARSPDDNVRGRAINALTEAGEGVSQSFVGPLTDADRDVRLQAAYAVSCLKLDPHLLVPVLRKGAKDSDPEIAAAMSKAVGFLLGRWPPDVAKRFAETQSKAD